jgi:hypothetical protein
LRAESLRPGGKHRLKMGTLFFPPHDPDINILEPGFFQEFVQLHLAETEPVIGVKVTGMSSGLSCFVAP